MASNIKIHGGASYDYVYVTTDHNRLPSDDTYNEPSWESASIMLATFDKDIDGSNYSSVTGSIVGYDVLRSDITTAKPVYVARLSTEEKRIYDYSARSKDTCSYTIYPIINSDETGAEQYSSPFSTESILPIYDTWTLINIVKEGDTVYHRGEFEWNFYVSSQPEQFTHNMGVELKETNSRYPSILKKNKNYTTGGLTVSSGFITDNGDYAENDFVFMRWEDFLNNKDPKMITDPYGHKYIVEITDSNHVSENYDANHTVISFSFVEIADASDISVYDIFDPMAEQMSDISGLSTAYGNGWVQLRWSDPENNTLGNATTVQWAGTKVVYSTKGYPETPDDGILVLDSTIKNAYRTSYLKIDGLTNGVTYYFSFFPYSTDGIYTYSEHNRVEVVPNRIPLPFYPSTNSTFVYNGENQTPFWDNIINNTLYISGSTSAINAGVYTTIFSPTYDYCWANGDTEPYSVQWQIEKEDGVVHLSNNVMLVDNTNNACSISTKIVGRGEIEVIINDEDVKVEITDCVVSFQINKSTTSHIKAIVHVAEDNNHNSLYQEEVDILYVNTADENSLNNASWYMISYISQMGYAKKYWSLGDKKTIIIGNQEYNVDIIGFSHDITPDGNYAGITFLLSTSWSEKYDWDYKNLNNWEDSSIRLTILPAIYEQMEDDLQKAVVSVEKKYAQRVDKTSKCTIHSTVDKLFLLTASELFAGGYRSLNPERYDAHAGFTGEGTIYEYFNSGDIDTNNLRRKKNNSWASRTQYSSIGEQNYGIVGVSENGSSTRLNTSFSCWISFAFCV